ncbi:MAG: DUF6110 family protein [Synergistaceae bacterium]|jgi:hypothetical protein|nr:DUF6110 family protein [Synergistaceae bacterium]
MKYEKAILFGAGLLAGVGVACFAKSKLGRKAAVAVVSKGLQLKECVTDIAERTKETVDDVIAEAKNVNEQRD